MSDSLYKCLRANNETLKCFSLKFQFKENVDVIANFKFPASVKLKTLVQLKD